MRCVESAYAFAALALPAAESPNSLSSAFSTSFSIFSSAAIRLGSGFGPPTNEYTVRPRTVETGEVCSSPVARACSSVAVMVSLP